MSNFLRSSVSLFFLIQGSSPSAQGVTVNVKRLFVNRGPWRPQSGGRAASAFATVLQHSIWSAKSQSHPPREHSFPYLGSSSCRGLHRAPQDEPTARPPGAAFCVARATYMLKGKVESGGQVCPVRFFPKCLPLVSETRCSQDSSLLSGQIQASVMMLTLYLRT